ncbi:MAG: hypothetical protein ABMA14_24230 [Hyphomonadaceae bacterium]
MPAASAQPVYRSIAHRKAVMQHIGATLLPSAIAFAVLAPLAGLALIWGSTLVAMICNAISTSGDSVSAALAVIRDTLVSAYLASAIAAGVTGVWVALLSPFTPDNPRYYIGAAIVGMLNTYLFVSVPAGTPALFGGQLFLALVGAVSAFLCARLLQDTVLKRDEARRDHLSRERAERLARERAKT